MTAETIRKILFILTMFAAMFAGCKNDFSGGRYIDLPEEISQADSTDILQATVTKDTIYISFKNQ